MRKIDSKFHIDGNEIIKTSNNTIIPEEEPLFLFRARDKLALRVLRFYQALCIEDRCTDYQLKMLENRIAEFSLFADKHPGAMKQPGITRGL